MARAVAIDTRLEKLIPSLEEYVVAGVFTKDEVRNISRQRTDIEYRLVAKPLLVVDVRRGIRMEQDIEEKIAEYCSTSKVTLKHRWVVQERIESIYQIGYKHLKDPTEKEAIRQEMITFLKAAGRKSSLSKFYAELVVRHPLTSAYWVEATWWQVEIGAMDHARALIQHAITTVPGSPDVWVCAFGIELNFAAVVLKTVLAERREREAKSEVTDDVVDTMRTQSATLANIALDLALAQIVLEEAARSDAASSPSLFLRLHEVALTHEFGAAIADKALQIALTKRLLPSFAEKSGPVVIHKNSWQNVWHTSPDTWRLVQTAATFPMTRTSKRFFDSAEEYLRAQAAGNRKRPAVTDNVWNASQFASLCASSAMLFHGEWEGVRTSSDEAMERLQRLFADIVLWNPPKNLQPLWAPTERDELVQRVVQYEGAVALGPFLSALGAPSPSLALQRVVVAVDGAVSRTRIAWRSAVIAKLVSTAEKVAQLVGGEQFIRSMAAVVTATAIEELMVPLSCLPSSEASNQAMQFLRASQLLVNETNQLNQAKLLSPELPVNLWKVLLVLAEAHPTTSLREGNHASENEDSDTEEPQRKRTRHEAVTLSQGDSFGLSAIRMLGRRNYAKLTATEQLQRNEGFFRLYKLLMRQALQLTEPNLDREIIAGRLAAMSEQERSATLRHATELIQFVGQYTPIPRLCLVEVERPLREALVLAVPKGNAAEFGAAVNAARECHRRILSLYRTLTAANSAALLTTVFVDGKGSNSKTAAAAATVQQVPEGRLHAQDWFQAVQFEREVVGDFPASQKLVSSAVREIGRAHV